MSVVGSDSQAAAPILPLGVSSAYTPNAALTAAGEPATTGQGKTAWWRFVPDADMVAVVDTRHTFGRGGTQLWVYRDTVQLGYDEGYWGDRSLVTFQAEAGSDYYIRVDATPTSGPLDYSVAVVQSGDYPDSLHFSPHEPYADGPPDTNFSPIRVVHGFYQSSTRRNADDPIDIEAREIIAQNSNPAPPPFRWDNSAYAGFEISQGGTEGYVLLYTRYQGGGATLAEGTQIRDARLVVSGGGSWPVPAGQVSIRGMVADAGGLAPSSTALWSSIDEWSDSTQALRLGGNMYDLLAEVSTPNGVLFTFNPARAGDWRGLFDLSSITLRFDLFRNLPWTLPPGPGVADVAVLRRFPRDDAYGFGSTGRNYPPPRGLRNVGHQP